MDCDVDRGDLLPGLSSACGIGVEDHFDGVVLGGQHSIGRRVFDRDDENGVLGRIILLAVGEDVGTIRPGRHGGGWWSGSALLVVPRLRSGRRWMLVGHLSVSPPGSM